jgi:hypothetical protein
MSGSVAYRPPAAENGPVEAFQSGCGRPSTLRDNTTGSTCRVEGNRLGGDAQRRHHSLTEQLDPRPTRAQLDHTGEHGIAEVGIPHVHVASARLLDEPAELGQDLAVDAIGGPGSVRVADSMGLRREDARQPGGVLDERAHGDRRRRGPAGKQSPADRASLWAE